MSGVFESTHQVRKGESLNSIAARFQDKPSDICERNNLVSSTVRPGQTILVIKPKGRKAACGRTCVLLTGKHWQRCECTTVRDEKLKNQQRPPRYSGMFNAMTKAFEMVMFASKSEVAPPYQPYDEYTQRFTSPPPALHQPHEIRSNYRSPSININPSSAASMAERAKFPVPIIISRAEPAIETVNLAKLYSTLGLNGKNDSYEGRPLVLNASSDIERTRFPRPIHPSSDEGRPLVLNASSDAERTRFPRPIHPSSDEGRPLVLNASSDVERTRFPRPIHPSSDEGRPLVLKIRSGEERSRFPVPHFSRAEIERSKFPVPCF